MTHFKSGIASCALSDVNPTDLGYVFPEPTMFLSAQKAKHQDIYFCTWLKFRSTMIYRLSSSSSAATPMPNAVWRNLLTLESVDNKKIDPPASTSTAIPASIPPQIPSTRAAKLREMTKDFLLGCFDTVEGVDLVQSSTIKWMEWCRGWH